MSQDKHWLGFEYCKPSEAGLESTDDAVEDRLGKLLTTMGTAITEWVVESGELTESIRSLRMEIHQKLQLDGWLIRGKDDGGWVVRHPATKADRMALAAAASRMDSSQQGFDDYRWLVDKAVRARRKADREAR